jgi:ABC-type glycerol-3-phosphate transport system substrate-binding protein
MKTAKVWLALLVIAPLLLLNCRDEVRSQEYFEKVQTAFVAGEPPDVLYVDTLRAPQLIEQGLLAPVDGAVDLQDIYPQLLEYFQREGQTYVVPRDFQTVEMALNLKLLEEMGVGLPPDNWTWHDLAEISAAMSGGDVHGLGLTPTMVNWLPFLFQAGGSLLNEDHTAVTLDSDQAREALGFWVDLVGNQWAVVPPVPVDQRWPDMGMYGDGGLLDMFVNDRLAMVMIGPSGYRTLVEMYRERGINDPPIRVVRLPVHPQTYKRTTVAYVVGFGLSSKAGEPATVLLNYIVSEEGMRIWFDPQSLDLQPPEEPPVMFVPTRMSLGEAWLARYQDATEADRSAAEAFWAGVEDIGFYQPLSLSFGQMAEFDQRAAEILRAALFGELSVDEAVRALQESGDAVIGRTSS